MSQNFCQSQTSLKETIRNRAGYTLVDEVLLRVVLGSKIGPATLCRVLDVFTQGAYSRFIEGEFDLLPQINEAVLQLPLCTKKDFEKTGIGSLKAVALVAAFKDDLIFEDECKYLQDYEAGYITILDFRYPQSLRSIVYPPTVIFFKGDFESLLSRPLIGVVGSRLATRAGIEITKIIVESLVKGGFGIISGGARGIDAVAHQVTLDHAGTTAVVFGGGLMSIYPKEHDNLFKNICMKGGVQISQFPMRTSPSPQGFPDRNRLIAAFSMGICVVQASLKSGSLITAYHALEQGKQVFAVPGDVMSKAHQGCHRLLREGAILVESAQDIFREYQVFFPQEGLAQLKEESAENYNEEKKGALKNNEKENCPIQGILMHGGQSIDELAKKLSISVSVLHEKLFMLEIEGKVKQGFSGLWEIV